MYTHMYKHMYGTNDTMQTIRIIIDVNGANTTNKRNMPDGHFNLTNGSRGQPEFIVNNDELRAIVEADLLHSMEELIAWLDVTICISAKFCAKLVK